MCIWLWTRELLKDYSALPDGTFFHSLARVSGNADRTFMKMLSEMRLWTRKSSGSGLQFRTLDLDRICLGRGLRCSSGFVTIMCSSCSPISKILFFFNVGMMMMQPPCADCWQPRPAPQSSKIFLLASLFSASRDKSRPTQTLWILFSRLFLGLFLCLVLLMSRCRTVCW